MRRLAIIGVGLLGGSVARGARAAGLAKEIVGIGRDPARLQPALADGALDHVSTDLAEGVRGADFVVLAVPVLASERLLERVWQTADDDAIITDVGSTKANVVAAARRLEPSRRVAFVGSHPMAGSDRSGYAFSRADLFQGAWVLVTPTESTEPRALKTVTEFWEALGARVASLDPERHDRVVAAISHLPHLVAYALVDAVTRFEPTAFEFAARGFKDTTRIAASDPRMWQEVFLANREALAASVDVFRRALTDLEDLVARGEATPLESAIAAISRQRESLR